MLASDLVEREDNTVYRRYHYTTAGELERIEDKTRPDQRFDYDRTGRLMHHWPAPMREEWFGYGEAANRILPGNDSSPRHMTVGDNRQREVDGYRYAYYDAWGEIDLYRAHQIDQPLRFQGQYADDEARLYYTTYRYYDPHAGRFTTQDPIGLAGGWNLYPVSVRTESDRGGDPLRLASCGASKGFNRRNGITRRWVDRLTGKKPQMFMII